MYISNMYFMFPFSRKQFYEQAITIKYVEIHYTCSSKYYFRRIRDTRRTNMLNLVSARLVRTSNVLQFAARLD